MPITGPDSSSIPCSNGLCKNSQNLLRLPSDFIDLRLHETFAKPNKYHDQGIKYLSIK